MTDKTLEIREYLINKIINEEWEMFSAVKVSEQVACQERPKTFRLMRWMAHFEHSDKFLRSYLVDLKNAKTEGRNLMTEKYARMENKIPPLKNETVMIYIREIAKIEGEWMEQLRNDYPSIFKSQGEHFQKYFTCELETYSENTIMLYYQEVKKAQRENKNIVRKRYEALFKKLGTGPLDMMDKKAP